MARGPRDTDRDTVAAVMAGNTRPLSVRLDPDAFDALASLTEGGLSRSEAIRQALVETAARRRGVHSLAAEAARLADDSSDRAEMAEVAALMESLRDPR